MAVFAPWVQARLQHANDWRAELALIRQALANEKRSAERLFDVARATEYCDPDRGRSLALYLEAWREGHADAREHACRLATQLGAHMTLAEIAKAEGDLLAEGTAYLDAGFRELALEPLEKFVKTRATSPGVTALVALARGAKLDAEREIADSVASAAYVHAARVARAAKIDGVRLRSMLAAAADDDTVAALVEGRLFETGNVDELLAHVGARLEHAPTRAAYAERARSAGVQLISQNVQPGSGLRLLRMGLESAYSALLPDITSHIAAWELLWTHAQVQHSTVDLIPLIEQALAAPLPEDDALYLARLGLEIAWRHARDIAAAKSFAAMVIELVPDHPLAAAFVTEAAPEMLDTRPAVLPPPVVVPPPPAVKPVTSRIPMLDDQGQVKRVEAPASATKKAHGVTGRMALLTPRAPASPPPPAPAPAPPPTPRRRVTFTPPAREKAESRPPHPSHLPRAPRKVVPVDVVVELANGNFFSTVLRDVSMSGAFVVTRRALDVASIVTLEMRVPTPNAVTHSSHRVTARIARRTDIGCGVAFIDATPELVAAIRAATE